MSRSRKKTAGYSHKDTLTKKKFNRSIRRSFRQAKLLEDGEGILGMSYEMNDGKEFRKHNCSYDIQDYHGIWWSYNEYLMQLEYWKVHRPTWKSFHKDNWYREIMK